MYSIGMIWCMCPCSCAGLFMMLNAKHGSTSMCLQARTRWYSNLHPKPDHFNQTKRKIASTYMKLRANILVTTHEREHILCHAQGHSPGQKSAAKAAAADIQAGHIFCARRGQTHSACACGVGVVQHRWSLAVAFDAKCLRHARYVATPDVVNLLQMLVESLSIISCEKRNAALEAHQMYRISEF